MSGNILWVGAAGILLFTFYVAEYLYYKYKKP